MFTRKVTYAAAVLAAIAVGGIPAMAATTGASKHGGTAKSKTQAKSKTKTGPRGPAGKAGKNGKNGTNGKDGKDGKNGSDGAAGAAGPAGANGAAGTVGPAGASFARTVIVSPTRRQRARERDAAGACGRLHLRRGREQSLAGLGRAGQLRPRLD